MAVSVADVEEHYLNKNNNIFLKNNFLLGGKVSVWCTINAWWIVIVRCVIRAWCTVRADKL